MSLDPADNRMVAYLLGTLTEDEQTRFELEVLAHDDRYEDMLAVEDELTYAYLQNELSADDRARFEARLASTPAGRQRAAFAGALLDVIGAVPAAPGARPASAASSSGRRPAMWPSSAYAWLQVAAAIAVMAGGVWMATSLGAMRRENARLQGEHSAREQQFRQEIDAARVRLDLLARDLASAQKRVVFSFFLTPGRTRSAGELSRIRVPSMVDDVQLRLERKNADHHDGYRTAIRTAEGDEVWSDTLPAPSADGTLTAHVPAAALRTGDYELTLTGLAKDARSDDLATYDFTVIRR